MTEIQTEQNMGNSSLDPTQTSIAEVTTLPSSNLSLENYIIISVSATFIIVLLIIILILLIRNIRNKCCNPHKHLETYSSITYDEESIDDELDNCDDLMYTSCKLLVGDGLGVDSDMTNSEPEYDCMSVDVSISANESSTVDWSRENVQESPQPTELSHSLKTLPHLFWRQWK